MDHGDYSGHVTAGGRLRHPKLGAVRERADLLADDRLANVDARRARHGLGATPAALQYTDQAQLNLRTVTVIRNGYIVLDVNTQPFNTDEGAPVFSVTKSVISLLIGIALHDGSLKNVDQKVVSFFPNQTFANPSPDKDAITIEDLLTMQSGLDCADDTLGPTIQDSQDWVQSILDLPMTSRPGTTFAYCSRKRPSCPTS